VQQGDLVPLGSEPAPPADGGGSEPAPGEKDKKEKKDKGRPARAGAPRT
jgi:hypothetical protein